MWHHSLESASWTSIGEFQRAHPNTLHLCVLLPWRPDGPCQPVSRGQGAGGRAAGPAGAAGARR